MDLNIGIINKTSKNNQKTVEGFIQIKDFEEHFDIPLSFWTIIDYENQWKQGLERLREHDASCLVVAISNPSCRKFIEWWLLYKINNKIHVQNHIIIDDLYDQRIGSEVFTLETCYNFIPPYRSHNEEGNKISEWIVDCDSSKGK